jgi:hypothetical protein
LISESSLYYAKTILRRFQRVHDRFFDTHPYIQLVEPHSDGVGRVCKIKLTKDIPERLTDHALGCIEHLRSALDQAGYAAARVSGSSRLHRTSFPFGDSKTYVDRLNAGSCKDLPDEIFELFCSFKPYKGGNNSLWALNKFCNTNKHKLIEPVLSTVQSIVGNATVKGHFKLFDPPVWDREKNELPIAILGPGAELTYKLRVGFHVVFGDVEAVSGTQVLTFLTQSVEMTETIVRLTEGKSKALGWL